DLKLFRSLVERYETEHNVPAIEIAAALAKLAQGDQPLLLDAASERPRAAYDKPARPHAARSNEASPNESRPSTPGRDAPRKFHESRERGEHVASREKPGASHKPYKPREAIADPSVPAAPGSEAPSGPRKRPPNQYGMANAAEALFGDDDKSSRKSGRRSKDVPEEGMETFRIELGHTHGVQPGNIVGAIANEADLESRYIGRIEIRDDYSLVDLPVGMSKPLLEHLKRVRIAGQPMRLQRAGPNDLAAQEDAGSRPYRPKPHGDRPRPAPKGSKPHRKGTGRPR
ncbi:MAG TPA: DbpA RNA binding domain-containing protein, partial [Xanthomonadaceae bacterium]|nr:DbpA RNA binding domain-containing protein [Xanthomonadaceae bacterium]